MQKIAKSHNSTVAQVALAWLFAKSHVASILLGASKISQLEDNLGAWNINLADDELATLDKITAPPAIYPNWFQAATLDEKTADALDTGIKQVRAA